jgi:hypothetical protein
MDHEWNRLRRQNRRESRGAILHVLLRAYRWMLLALACLVILIILSWHDVLDIGDLFPLQEALVVWAIFLVCRISPALRLWRHHVAATLYYEDIAEGVCPDRGMQITPENGWKWYRKQRSPWWISLKRARPEIHVDDALARLEGCNPSPRASREDI